jgi:hypothetical protein
MALMRLWRDFWPQKARHTSSSFPFRILRAAERRFSDAQDGGGGAVAVRQVRLAALPRFALAISSREGQVFGHAEYSDSEAREYSVQLPAFQLVISNPALPEPRISCIRPAVASPGQLHRDARHVLRSGAPCLGSRRGSHPL